MTGWTSDSPIGRLGLGEEDGALVRLWFGGLPAGIECKYTPLMQRGFDELDEYFRGNRRAFTVPLAPKGTPFQQSVWQALCSIPYGETRSYGQIAAQIGNPKGSRAVGMANNKNPLAIFIPCHRVVGANGKLVGYAGGLSVKEILLHTEQPLAGCAE